MSTRGALDRGANWRREQPARPQPSSTYLEGCGMTPDFGYALCDPVTLIFEWPFDIIFIDGRWLVLNYPCAKFGDFSFSRFGFILRTDRQVESLTESINQSIN